MPTFSKVYLQNKLVYLDYGIFFVGYYFLNENIDKKLFYVFFLGYLVIYIFGTGNYPDALMVWFKTVGDRFTFVKASDMVLATIY